MTNANGRLLTASPGASGARRLRRSLILAGMLRATSSISSNCFAQGRIVRRQFKYLLNYSPYHNVKDGVKYPAVLFVAGDGKLKKPHRHSAFCLWNLE